MKKKGFTLIETTIALAITGIILTIVMNSFFNHVKLYKLFVSKDKQENYAKEALRFMEAEINDIQNVEVIFLENRIIIRKARENGGSVYTENTIYAPDTKNDRKKIVMLYKPKDTSKTNVQTIVDNIKDFKIYKDENVVYLCIENRNGEKYEKCVGIREVKKDLQ